jgi:hypothetical protein
MPACCRHYPGRSERFNRSVLIPRHQPSPNFEWVGSCIIVFEACSAFTRVTACRLARSPMRPSTPEASAALSPPPPLRLLPGGAIQFPGGSFSPAVDQHLFTAHRKIPITLRIPRRLIQARSIARIGWAHSIAMDRYARFNRVRRGRTGSPQLLSADRKLKVLRSPIHLAGNWHREISPA